MIDGAAVGAKRLGRQIEFRARGRRERRSSRCALDATSATSYPVCNALPPDISTSRVRYGAYTTSNRCKVTRLILRNYARVSNSCRKTTTTSVTIGYESLLFLPRIARSSAYLAFTSPPVFFDKYFFSSPPAFPFPCCSSCAIIADTRAPRCFETAQFRRPSFQSIAVELELKKKVWDR